MGPQKDPLHLLDSLLQPLQRPVSANGNGSNIAVPMDFGESLPPTLTALMDKQFRLYR